MTEQEKLGGITETQDLIDQLTLALMALTSFRDGKPPCEEIQAWKGYDWDALDRLTAAGFLKPTRCHRRKSRDLTEEGFQVGESLAEKFRKALKN